MTEAGDGDEALAAIEAAAPDLALASTSLPSIDGLALCRRLRLAMRLPVILIAPADQDLRVQAMLAGAEDYVLRPVLLSELMDRNGSPTRAPCWSRR